MYNDISKYLSGSSIRHFNKKGDGSLTGMRISIGEDSKTKLKDVIFISGVEYKGVHKGDGVKDTINGFLSVEELYNLEKIILEFHGYNNEVVSNGVILDNKSLKLEATKQNKDILFTFTSKKEGDKTIKFDLQYIESVKFLKLINKIKSMLNNRVEFDKICEINNRINNMKLEDSSLSVKGVDGTIKKIQPTTIEHNSINITREKLQVGSYLNFRNKFLNIGNEQLNNAGTKYPVTLVTQQMGYSFSLPIEEEINIMFEKYLKGYGGKQAGKATKFLTDIEEKFLKSNGIFSVYNNKGTNMYQFKIFSESGTSQYSINSKDKSLTVTRMGIATTDDIDRIRKIVVKIKSELESGNLNSEEYKKAKIKFDTLITFGKKLKESNKSNSPYFTTFLKIEDVAGLTFKVNLINSYILSPLKSEKDKLLGNLNNLYKALEDGKIAKEDAKIAINGLDDMFQSKTFFKKEIKLDKNNVSISYDARFVPLLLKGGEDRNHKTFKFNFKSGDRNTSMLLDLGDIKKLIDSNGEFLKEIDYNVDNVNIKKRFEIKETEANFEFSYKDNEDNFKGTMDKTVVINAINTIKKEFIIKDIYLGDFYNKNYAYMSYKINNYDAVKINEFKENSIKNKAKSKLSKLK